MREYAVIIEKGPNCWGAYVPDLPGLAATGKSVEEVRQLIHEGLELHLEGMLEDGDRIPEPVTVVAMVKTDIVENWPQRFAKSA